MAIEHVDHPVHTQPCCSKCALKDGVLLTYFHFMVLGSDLQVWIIQNEHILWFYLHKELICLRL